MLPVYILARKNHLRKLKPVAKETSNMNIPKIEKEHPICEKIAH